MGRGVIQDVSAKIVTTFSQNLEAMLSGAPAQAAPAQPAPAGPLRHPPGPPRPERPPRARSRPLRSPRRRRRAQVPAPAEESALPVGRIVGSVVAERLRDPKASGVGGLAAARGCQAVPESVASGP